MTDPEPQASPTSQTGETDEVLTEDKLVDEMAEETFPTSDPPSTWAGKDGGA